MPARVRRVDDRALRAGPCAVSQPHLRRSPCVVDRHSSAHVFRNQHVEVKVQLVNRVGEWIAAPETHIPPHSVSSVWHRSLTQAGAAYSSPRKPPSRIAPSSPFLTAAAPGQSASAGRISLGGCSPTCPT